MAEKLKSCPFCGGEASVGTVKYNPCDITKLNNREKGYFVNCQICSARNEWGISYATEKEAVTHWNTRAYQADLDCMGKEIEGLRESCKAHAEYARQRLDKLQKIEAENTRLKNGHIEIMKEINDNPALHNDIAIGQIYTDIAIGRIYTISEQALKLEKNI